MQVDKNFDLCSMKLNDCVSLETNPEDKIGYSSYSVFILRVPGGWLYTYNNPSAGFFANPFFVAYNEEFK
jgi:hypothetical protein